MRSRLAGLGATVAVLAAFAGACDPPPPPGAAASASASATAAPAAQERWTEVASDVAPLIQSITEEFPPPLLVRRGELLKIGKSVKASTWKGPLDDVPIEREGMLFAAQITPEGSG